MRLLRSLVVVVLCLTLGSAVASAAEPTPGVASREAGGITRLLNNYLGAFLKAVWENTGCEIDPWGRCVPGTGTPDPASPSTDEGSQIDPLG